jgi:hypothetical protein
MPELDLTEQESTRLAHALGTEPGSDAYEERLALLGEVATEEFVDWILARRRFETVSAIDRHRILQIFARIRQQAPTIEALSNDLDISESRASSLLSRMRYGEARLIRGLIYNSAREEVSRQLESARDSGGRKFIWVTSDTGRVIDEANTAIMMDQVGRRPGGAFEGAEKADRQESTRTGHLWSATDRMWEFIVVWIENQATQTGLPE